MDALNRGLAVLLMLAIIAAGVVTVLIAAEAVAPDDLPEGALQPQAQDLVEASGGVTAIVITISVVAALLMLILLRYELLPSRRERRLVISSGEAGEATITQDSVAALAEHLDPGIREVKDIRCRVIVENTGVAIKSKAIVTMGANLPELCPEIQADITRRVEEYTGLRVVDVHPDTRYDRARPKHVRVR